MKASGTWVGDVWNLRLVGDRNLKMSESLFGCLNFTVTGSFFEFTRGMGTRMLRSAVLQPLIDPLQIKERQAGSYHYLT